MPFGPASSWTYGNGVTDTRTFDLDYRMTSVTDTGTGNIQYLSYSYNAANLVTAITDHVTRRQQPDLHLRPHRADHLRVRLLRHRERHL